MDGRQSRNSKLEIQNPNVRGALAVGALMVVERRLADLWVTRSQPVLEWIEARGQLRC